MVSELKGYTGSVNSITWSPKGAQVASVSSDKTVIIWDVASGAQVSTLKGHTDQVWSVVWSPKGDQLASASWDKTIIFWDTALGQQVSTLKGTLVKSPVSRGAPRATNWRLALVIRLW